MESRRVVALVVLFSGALLGFIGFVIGVSKFRECSNELGVWLVAMGVMTMSTSLTACAHVEVDGVSNDPSKYRSWFDLILTLVLLSFNIWGTVILSQTSSSVCSEVMYSFAQFAVAVAWIITITVILAIAILFKKHITGGRSNV